MTKKKPNIILRAIFAIGVVELVGGIGGLFTAPAIPTWYSQLQKPALNPPSWVFGPVWTVLYAMMGVAAFLVWQKGLRRKDVRGALTVFGVQLVLNAIWSGIFFGLRNPGLAFFELIALWIAIAATLFVFWKISKAATWLLVPYILWVSFAGYLNYSLWTLNKGFVAQPVCTMEAKLCPDGSFVGRTGPNCEFAACPVPTIDPSWKTFTDDKKKISFRYPEKLDTTYMRAVDWPPQVATTEGPFECTVAGSENSRAGKTEPRTINGHAYCVTRESEGAAGSIYTQFAYAMEKEGKILIFTATLQAVQCANYIDPQKTACSQERSTFDLDKVMDRIMQTVSVR